jgi:signal transduction histidine kinase
MTRRNHRPEPRVLRTGRRSRGAVAPAQRRCLRTSIDRASPLDGPGGRCDHARSVAIDGIEHMTEVRRRRLVLLARIISALTVLGVAFGLWLSTFEQEPTDLGLLLAFALFPFVGYLMATRRPDNSLSWLVLGIGATIGLGSVLESYGGYAVNGGIGGRTAGLIAVALDTPLWVPVVGLPATFLLLLFPDGHLPSPRWRWSARILAVSMVIIYLSIVLHPGRFGEEAEEFANFQNPLGVEWLRSVLDISIVSLVMLPIGVIGSLVALVRRFRRSSGIERLQLRWLVTAATIVAVLYTAALLIGFSGSWSGSDQPTWMTVLQEVSVFSFGLIPIAIGASVLRYHLFDIDVVINRALLFGALAVFIAAVYVGVVVGVGALVGSRANPILSAAAAAIVALAFQPARSRAQRFADRLVYGERAAPYEVLSEFSERLGNVYATEELLPRMTRALAGGTGAVRADVWVRIGAELEPEATWPLDADPLPPIAAVDDAVGEVSASGMREPIRHQGELLGALSIVKRPGESISPTEEKLVRDLAGQAGLVMRNVALTEQLMDHIEELRASRQRLVNAQDEERRKLERNLHDGAQQQLVALSVKLRLAEALAARDPEKTQAMLANLQTETGQAIEDLRDLARGIYPPLLADKGLVAALEAQARKSPIATSVSAENIARYPEQMEAAVYFCTLEALNNVAKYSGASSAEVRLTQSDGDLTFEVTDNGAGFDTDRTSYGTGLRGMADRIEVIGGVLKVRSASGRGTSITGRIPIEVLLSEPSLRAEADGTL